MDHPFEKNGFAQFPYALMASSIVKTILHSTGVSLSGSLFVQHLSLRRSCTPRAHRFIISEPSPLSTTISAIAARDARVLVCNL